MPSPTPLKGYLCSPAYSAVRFGLSLQISHPLQMPTKQRIRRTLHNAGAKRRRNRSGLGFSLDRHYIRHDDVPQVTLRFFAGKNLNVMKWSAAFSSIYLTMIYVFTPCVGMIGRLLMPDIAAPDTIFPELLLKYTPAVFAALIISGALAAAMSTGDSQLHATSTMVATDSTKNS